MALLGFIFRNFFLLVGIGVLISVVYHILAQDKKDAMMHKGSAVILLAAFLLHSILYWKLTDDPDLLVYVAQCVIPGLVAWFAGGVMYHVKPGTVREIITIGIAYVVTFLLTLIFRSWIVSVLAAIVAMCLAGFVLTDIGKQWLMDYHASDPLLGDSDEVKKLYKEGYRPTDYYRTDEKAMKARKKLNDHGIYDV